MTKRIGSYRCHDCGKKLKVNSKMCREDDLTRLIKGTKVCMTVVGYECPVCDKPICYTCAFKFTHDINSKHSNYEWHWNKECWPMFLETR